METIVMMGIIAKFVLSVLALLTIAHYVPGIELSSIYIAVIVAVIFGVLGVTVKPVLTILTLPITIITFGLFAFVLNAFLFWFVASFVQGFDVHGFVPALIGSFVYALASWIINLIF